MMEMTELEAILILNSWGDISIMNVVPCSTKPENEILIIKKEHKVFRDPLIDALISNCESVTYYRCPNCHCPDILHWFSFCPICGKKIDTSNIKPTIH